MMDATHNGWGTVQEMQLPLTQPNYITLMRHGQQLLKEEETCILLSNWKKSDKEITIYPNIFRSVCSR